MKRKDWLSHEFAKFGIGFVPYVGRGKIEDQIKHGKWLNDEISEDEKKFCQSCGLPLIDGICIKCNMTV